PAAAAGPRIGPRSTLWTRLARPRGASMCRRPQARGQRAHRSLDKLFVGERPLDRKGHACIEPSELDRTIDLIGHRAVALSQRAERRDAAPLRGNRNVELGLLTGWKLDELGDVDGSYLVLSVEHHLRLYRLGGQIDAVRIVGLQVDAQLDPG